MTEHFLKALDAGLEVAIIFVGLDSVERHITRVRSRARSGGHDIPDEKIRARYESSRANLLRLAPRVTELRVFDNSREADPKTGQSPAPMPLLHAENGRLRTHIELEACPAWAKPIFAVLLKNPA